MRKWKLKTKRNLQELKGGFISICELIMVVNMQSIRIPFIYPFASGWSMFLYRLSQKTEKQKNSPYLFRHSSGFFTPSNEGFDVETKMERKCVCTNCLFVSAGIQTKSFFHFLFPMNKSKENEKKQVPTPLPFLQLNTYE